ncbi:MAG: hypothetical protein O3A50_02345 [Planctomycetota bacterium]|nr:hypothetical protein [Planctomycetota bacterium]
MIALSSALLLSLIVPFQQGGASTVARKNAEAARAINREFGLDLWAEKLIVRSLAVAKSPDDRSELLLARCDVLLHTARSKVNDTERLPALGEAGEAYVAYLETSPGGVLETSAQSNLGEVASQYGITLVSMIETDTISGAEKDAAVATAETIFKTSLKGMNSIIDWWTALPADNNQKNLTQFNVYYPSVFNRALVYLYWAQLYPAGSIERDQRAKQAVGYFEEFAIGAPFIPSMRAYKALADCYFVLGQMEASFDYYEYVTDNTKELLEEERDTQSPDFIEALHDVIMDSDRGMLQLLAGTGQTDQFWKTAENFNSWVDEERVQLTRTGYELQLIIAQQMIEEGRIGEAISLAELVAKDNERSTLRLRANSVMGNAIALAPPNADIPLDVLYGSAEGAYFQNDYSAAIDGFRMLIPRLAGSSQNDEYGAKTYYLLGICWARTEQPLLAAVTHQIGYNDYPDDDEYAEKNAQKWQGHTGNFFKRASSDPEIQKWNDDAIQAVVDSGGGGNDLEWGQAKTMFSLAQKAAGENPRAAPGSAEAKTTVLAYGKAVDAFKKVKPESKNYEQSLVRIATSEYESIRFDPSAAGRSLSALNYYLVDYIGNSANDPKDGVQRRSRTTNQPSAVSLLGRTYRAIAQAGDAGAWQDVIDTYANMLERFPDQLDIGYIGMAYRVEAFVQLGKIEEAEAEYQAMLEVSASPDRLAIACFSLFMHYKATGASATKVAQIIALREKEAEYLSSYNTFSTNKRWTNLLGEADLWMQLGDYGKSSVLFQLVLDKYSSDKSFNDAFRFKTQIGLVESLLQLRRTGEAIPLVNKLYEESPKNLRVRSAVVKVKAGFLVYNGNQVLEVPGEGTPEALELASTMASELIKVAEFEADSAAINPYAYVPWWEAKLDQGYVLYQQGKADPAQAGKHTRMVGSLQRQAPELGESIAGKRMSQSLLWLLNH